MSNGYITDVLIWLGTYLLHSTLILGGVWLVELLRRGLSPALRDSLWRTALLAGIVTATLQTNGVVQSAFGNFEFPLGRATTIEASTQYRVGPSESALDTPSDIAEFRFGADAPGSMQPVDAPSNMTGRPTQSSATDSGGFSSASLLLLLWLAGTTILSVRFIVMARSAQSALSDRTASVSGPVFERTQALSRAARLKRPPPVSLSESIHGPLALPNGEICIPSWAHEGFSTAQLDALLAHEIAHVVRRDALWRVISVIVQTLLFIQPLNILAGKRLALLAELSADEWAVAHTGDGRALAESLARIAEITKSGQTPIFAVAMSQKESSFVYRVRQLLDGRFGRGVISMRSKALIVSGAVLLSGVMPGLMAQPQHPSRAFPELPAPPRAPLTGPSDLVDGFVFNWPTSRIPRPPLSSDGDSRIDMELPANCRRNFLFFQRCDERSFDIRGSIQIVPDGSGILAISHGGHVDVTIGGDGVSHRVRFSGSNGEVDSEYWIGRARQPWDAAAERFVLEMMPILLRSTGLGARERVSWLLENGGHQAILEEIDSIDSDWVRQIYIMRYADSGMIPSDDFHRLITLALNRIGSDWALSVALASLYEAQRPGGEDLVALIRAGQAIDSDWSAASLLRVIGASLPSTDVAISAYLSVATTLQSEFSLQSALPPLLLREDLLDSHRRRIIDSVAPHIDSRWLERFPSG